MKLNLGCSRWLLEGWINVDADPESPADLHCEVPPIPFIDGGADEIYMGHLLEHFTYEDGQRLLAECYRVLVPGGRLGIVVPDMRLVMKRWLAGEPDAVMLYPDGVWREIADLDEVCTMFWYTKGERPHKWAYDKDTLGRAMARAGFRKLREIDRYRDQRLASPAWYQVGVEGFKPERES